MASLFQIVSGIIVAIMAAGSLLNLSRNPHWFVRGWEFPRLQIVGLTALSAFVYWSAGNWKTAVPAWIDDAVIIAAVATCVWHLFWVKSFTVFYPQSVRKTPRDRYSQGGRIRIACTNVEMGNRHHDRWQRVLAEADADIVLAVEVDETWVQATAELQKRYEHRVIQSQSNYYGMMLLSRLPLRDTEVRYIVQDDIPSIHTTVVLRDGTEVELRGLHPRPPEPLRDVDSHHRDAELVVVGREIAETDKPAIACGDLNDVAWSATSRLFVKVSRLLDPRVGRGLYNTWNARYWLIRLPLDHFFHSPNFTLRELRRLDNVGSDHFPILIDLQYTPAMGPEQPPRERDEAADERAQEIVDYEQEETEETIDSHQTRER